MNTSTRNFSTLGLLAFVGALLAAFTLFFGDFKGVYLYPLTPTSVAEVFMGLFIVSALLERAQEVYVSAWFAEGSEALKLAIATSEHPVEAKKEYISYRSKIRKYAFLMGLSIAFFISVAGLRVLEPLVDKNAANLGELQQAVFYGVDILLTTAVLAGGSDGIHKLTALITDFLEETRRKINAT